MVNDTNIHTPPQPQPQVRRHVLHHRAVVNYSMLSLAVLIITESKSNKKIITITAITMLTLMPSPVTKTKTRNHFGWNLCRTSNHPIYKLVAAAAAAAVATVTTMILAVWMHMEYGAE